MTIVVFTLFALLARADESVIDLGELKVRGDVRRPSVNFYQLKAMHESQLAELSELTFKDFEKSLLESDKKEGANETR